jgi:hypothetical protein
MRAAVGVVSLCPFECPIDQRKRPQQLVTTEGVLLSAQDFMNILNSQFLLRNEEVRGSSPLTSTKSPRNLNSLIATHAASPEQ